MFADHLSGWIATQEGHHLRVHGHLAERHRQVGVLSAGADLPQIEATDRPSLGAPPRVASDHEGMAGLQVELGHDERRALMQMDGAGVHGVIGSGFLDDPDDAPGRTLHHADAAPDPTQREPPRWPVRARPIPPRGPDPQHAIGHQPVDEPASSGSEQLEIHRRQRQLGGRAEQVRREQVRVVWVDHGCLDRAVEDRGGVIDEVAIQRVIRPNEHRQRGPPGPASPPDLLPKRGEGARPPGQQHGVQPRDIDAEFQSRRRGQSLQAAVPQVTLQRSAFLGQITAPVCRDRSPISAGVAPSHARDHLGSDPGPGERHRLHPGIDEAPQEVGGLGHRASPLGGQVTDRPVRRSVGRPVGRSVGGPVRRSVGRPGDRPIIHRRGGGRAGARWFPQGDGERPAR